LDGIFGLVGLFFGKFWPNGRILGQKNGQSGRIFRKKYGHTAQLLQLQADSRRRQPHWHCLSVRQRVRRHPRLYLYLPRELKLLQDEYDHVGGGGRDAAAIARQWEEQGEYERAIETYLRMDDDGGVALARAAELAAKFLEPEHAAEVAATAGPQLAAARRHSAAAQLYLGVDMVREAVDALADGGEWDKARKVARELEPRVKDSLTS
jgi:hypothetical protein